MMPVTGLMPATGTIYAVSSGLPPAAIAILRISGPAAGIALTALGGSIAAPRYAQLTALHDPSSGALLDRALTLWFPGPGSATGEDLAEIHAHGGRAVIDGLLGALSTIANLRPAEPGEFTRRALIHGRIDLAQAEGLADLLTAETARQRLQALQLSGGQLSRLVETWQDRLLLLSARIEATLDFADEEDAAGEANELDAIRAGVTSLADEWRQWLDQPAVEPLRDGIRVAIAGPPNAGKSTLLNALVQREAAIVSQTPGTTRDVVEIALAIDGVAFQIADTAGLRDDPADPVEREGIRRAERWMANADCIVWLGAPDDAPQHDHVCRVAARSDIEGGAEVGADRWATRVAASDVVVSARTGAGIAALQRWLVDRARKMLPADGRLALNQRHRSALEAAAAALGAGNELSDDPLLLAEKLRQARGVIDTITGRAGTESMLDALFHRFCIGK